MTLRTVLAQKSSGRGYKYIVDPIFWALVSFSFITTMFYASVGVNLDEQVMLNKAIFMSILGISGITLYMTTVGLPRIDVAIDHKERDMILAFALPSLFAVLSLQMLIINVYERLAVMTIPARILLFNISIHEELFFRYFIQGSILSRDLPLWLRAPLAIGLNSVIGTMFHIPYSGFPQYLLAVFSSFIVISIVVYLTKRPSIGFIIHAANNLL